MKTYTLNILVLVVLCFTSCSKPKDEYNPKEKDAYNLYYKGYELAAKKQYKEALSYLFKAEAMYDSLERPGLYFTQYQLLRLQANLLDYMNIGDKAVDKMEQSIEKLEIAYKHGIETDGNDLTRHEYDSVKTHSQRFLAVYYRNNYDFESSIKIIEPILIEHEFDPSYYPGLNSTLRNIYGRNFYDIQSFRNAYNQFDIALKPSTTKTSARAYILQNKAWAALKIGQSENLPAYKDSAFVLMEKSKELRMNNSNGSPLYKFVANKDLGEMYMLEGNYDKAMEYFEAAMSIEGVPVNVDPDLFNIYQFRAFCGRATGRDMSSSDALLFEKLSQDHEAYKYKMQADIREVILMASIHKMEASRNSLPWYQQLPSEAWAGLFLILGCLIFGVSTGWIKNVLASRRTVRV